MSFERGAHPPWRNGHSTTVGDPWCWSRRYLKPGVRFKVTTWDLPRYVSARHYRLLFEEESLRFLFPRQFKRSFVLQPGHAAIAFTIYNTGHLQSFAPVSVPACPCQLVLKIVIKQRFYEPCYIKIYKIYRNFFEIIRTSRLVSFKTTNI